MAVSRIRWFLAIDAFLVAACLFGLDGLNRKACLPVEIGLAGLFDASRSPAPAGPVVHTVDAEDRDFRPGDVIVRVSGQRVSTQDEMEFVCDLANIGQRVLVGLERAGTRVDVEATLVRGYHGGEVAINGLVAAVFFGLAILVTLRRPDDEAALLFNASSASFAILMAATWGALGAPRAGAALAVRLVFGAAYALAPVLFLHFTLLFPRRARISPRGALVLLYGAALVLAAGQGLGFSRAFASGRVPDFRAFHAWFDASRLLAVLGLLGGVVRLAYAYATAREESERRRVRLVVPGFAVPVLAFVGLWIVPALVISGRPLVPEALLNLVALAAPLAFSAAIVRDHALDIDQILNRSTVYAAVVAVLAILYTALTAPIVWALGVESRGAVMAVSGAAAVCGALLFEPVRRRLQVIVDRTFFRVRYDAGTALREIRSRIAEAVDEGDLAEQVVGELDRRLQPERVAFLSARSDAADLSILAERGTPAPDLRLDRSRLPRGPAVSRHAVEAGEAMAEADQTVLQALGAIALFPFAAANAWPLGLLVLGRKRSAIRLSLEDLGLLRGVAEEVGRAVERLRLREELRKGKEEARRVEELARAHSDFVSSVTHELRTPLTSIRMFAELLRTGDVPAERANEYLSMVEGEADRLTRLIQNVLDFGRIERSVKEYRFQRIAADAAVCAALETLRYSLELAGFRLALSLAAPGAAVRADPDSFRQALVNLVENAMKYAGEERSIRVETRCTGGEFAVAVSDRGIGIAAADQARIFEPFVRGSGEAVRQAAGTGLGLSIVRHVMEAHSGRVELASRPGGGSTFTLVFPVDSSDAADSRH